MAASHDSAIPSADVEHQDQMPVKLSFSTQDGSFRAVNLDPDQGPLVLGRDRKSAQLVIPDPQVSRAHCSIADTERGIAIEDLGSRNGTFVNDQEVKRAAVKPGDRILIGGTEIKCERVDEQHGTDRLLGQNLGGFQLLEVLGKGNYGTVYRGMQVALRRPVAIKVLDDRHKADPERVKNFLAEARRAGGLNHPNVVQVHDVRQVGDNYLLIMELMTGGSVADFLRTDGPLNEDAICAVMVDIGRALAYAESQRLVHRDVKPDNILVNAEGVYKLADLGIAEPIAADGHAHQVKTFGSAHYVAPEQAMGGAIDGRADIYALGASVFHLATGRTLYQGSARQIVAAHINQPAPNLAESAPQLSSPLIELIGEMLEKESDHRPASGNDIAERVVQIVEGAVSAPAARRSGPMRVRRRRRRRRR